MSELFSHINWLAILIALVANQIIGGLWYSPLLFAKPWMKAAKVTEEDIKSGNNAPLFIGAIIMGLIAAIILALIIVGSGSSSATSGACIGFSCGLGLVGGSIFTHHLFEARDKILTLINVSHNTVSYTVMGIIIGVWQ